MVTRGSLPATGLRTPFAVGGLGQREDREICGINPQKRWFLGSDTIQNFCTGTLFLPSFGVSDTMKPSIFFWEILMERDDWPGKFWRWGAMSTRLNDRDSEGLKKVTVVFFRWLLNQWEFQDPKIEVLYHIRPYFVGTFPYIGLIYGRYLEFRFLNFPLIKCLLLRK